MNGPVEPHADIRQATAVSFQVYVALVEQGFTEQQALYLVAQMVRPQQTGQGQ